MCSEMKSHSSLSLRKIVMWGSSIFGRGFDSSKCKTEAKLASARIKLLRNKREVQVRKMRRDIAMLLSSPQEHTARIRVEHVIREENIMAANEIIDLFCELIVVRLPIIAKQRDCPADLKEGISSLIYAAPRCSEIPELYRMCDIFKKKYGKDFVSAAGDLRPESGVNRLLIEKLSVRKPGGEVKLKVLQEIAKEYQIEWDTSESKLELLKPPEELLEGPRSFVSASSMPIRHTLPQQHLQPKHPNFREGSSIHIQSMDSATQAATEFADSNLRSTTIQRCTNDRGREKRMHFKDATATSRSTKSKAVSGAHDDYHRQEEHLDRPVDPKRHSWLNDEFNKSPRKSCNESNSRNGPPPPPDDDDDDLEDNNRVRRNCRDKERRREHIDIEFDDSDGLDSDSDEEEVGMEMHSSSAATGNCPPKRLAPLPPPLRDQYSFEGGGKGDAPPDNNSCSSSRVHPKLPDYETIAARFEALKSGRSS